jgi:hypothetical protein
VDEPLSRLGARVLTLVGAAAAALALALPCATEDRTVSVEGHSELLTRGGERWSGWNLAATSGLDGHRPVPVVVWLLVIVGTLALLAFAWLGFERVRRRWIAPVTAAVAAVLLVGSVWMFGGIAGTYGAGHLTRVEAGVPVWRCAVGLVLLGALRLAALDEAPRVPPGD